MKKNKQGFTLVELLVYIGIFSVLLLVLTQIFISTINAQLSAQSSSGTSQDSRYILSRLIYDISRADALISPAAIGGAPVNNLTLKIGANNYVYTLTGSNLTLTVGAASDQLNGPDTEISTLEFTRLGDASNPPLVKVNYVLKSRVKTTSGYEIKNVDTVIGLRPN